MSVLFSGAVEACLLHGLRKRSLGLFKHGTTTALLQKIAKNFQPAAHVLKLVNEIEASNSTENSSKWVWQCDHSFCIHPGVLFLHPLSLCHASSLQLSPAGWVLLYVHRNHRLIRDGSPGQPPQLSHSSALVGLLIYVASMGTETSLYVT